ncbi:hypothetical protein GCM10027047_35440 [Rhodococcus aerolatus]
MAGFPAFRVTRPTDPLGCIIVVDVADGQLLETQRDDDTGTPLELICSAAQQLAEIAMTNLLAQR